MSTRQRLMNYSTLRTALVMPRDCLVVTVVAALLAGVVSGGASRASAASPSPGKTSAFASSDFGGTGDIPFAFTTLLSASIAKGKSKSVLVINGMLSSGSSLATSTFYLRVSVNGVWAEPQTFGTVSLIAQGCGVGGSRMCTLTGTWWLDLDAAELANPGSFKGKPLEVVLEGGEEVAAIESQGRVTLSVVMQKK